MSKVIHLFQSASYDAEHVRAMGQAYDLACQVLQDVTEIEVELIAKAILLAARSGERDATKLCDSAVNDLRAANFRRPSREAEMDIFIHSQNLLHFRTALEKAGDEAERKRIQALLEEEEAKGQLLKQPKEM